ncbi:hypothetical protein GMOD_00004350 [Pyrenophora seminiperda CCB06]|uniref:Uncharacterized protein n=1 Tax=Pyrenophora seminiperda CCB06 TaxID=1302712 RepID=A0A3M7M119_9PLEO|nr:hypothetical protein GMOD_00004350 [Pyrenophora seminiperda CCB06]
MGGQCGHAGNNKHDRVHPSRLQGFL